MEKNKIVQIINVEDHLFGIAEDGSLYKVQIKNSEEGFYDEAEWKFVALSPLEND